MAFATGREENIRTLVANHNHLTFPKTELTLSRRQARWVENLERIGYAWLCRSSRTNMADSLCRNPTPMVIKASWSTPLKQGLTEAYLLNPWLYRHYRTTKLTFEDGLWLTNP